MRGLIEQLPEQQIRTVANIRAIADTLRQHNRFQDALIVIHSDHGTLLRSHSPGMK